MMVSNLYADWLINFNGMSTCLALFKVNDGVSIDADWLIDLNSMSMFWFFFDESLGKSVHCLFIITFFVKLFLRDFLHSYMILTTSTNNLHPFSWFQVFLSYSNNSMASSNYFDLILVICLYTVIISITHIKAHTKRKQVYNTGY